jgi:hypothetical protein
MSETEAIEGAARFDANRNAAQRTIRTGKSASLHDETDIDTSFSRQTV